MDPNLAAELEALSKLSHRRIFHVFQSDSPRRYELTKSLVDVLYNICVVQSVEAPDSLKKVLEEHEDTVRRLLSRKASLASKKTLLQANVPLAVAIAQSCPLLV